MLVRTDHDQLPVIAALDGQTPRARNDLEGEVKLLRLFNDRYTTIHPSVRWRFEEELSAPKGNRGKRIMFDEVWPLYAQADIVHSSGLRNHAISQDLIEQATMAERVLNAQMETCPLLLVPQVLEDLQRLKYTLQHSFNTQIEFGAQRFFRHEILPLFRDFHDTSHPAPDHLVDYLDSTGTDGIFGSARDRFEESIDTVNEMISRVFLEREAEAQAIIPHVCQTCTTDGMSFQLYAGQSLLKDQKFRGFHLDNLISWQLITLCEIARAVEFVQDQLPLPVQTAQLMLAYHSPVQLVYRQDIKRLAVPNGRHVHYEILKKRIEKATIEDTGQRLTQSGKIAIAYALDDERDIYLRQLDYLKSAGYIHEELEEVRLAPLQGIRGLKALRFRVVV
ncbi:MAG: hypothetical protein R3330_01015 [Saprospiraceae bacterium]|nr:hypothetical protein [Saprospiraceae bacterium]